ncbi:hypothetical protein AB0I28_32855 [Phytomonospora sp. NPDC050363]|uniref:hypothetical protein n=1 Tax=Phytomonospora sp. NPDC050363 TaxID=3155642 RepID=UPI0034110961
MTTPAARATFTDHLHGERIKALEEAPGILAAAAGVSLPEQAAGDPDALLALAVRVHDYVHLTGPTPETTAALACPHQLTYLQCGECAPCQWATP